MPALTPKAVRLSTDNRATILNYAGTVIDCPVERVAEGAAHARLFLTIVDYLTVAVPVSDLAVLRAYNSTRLATVARFNRPDGEPVNFCFCPRDVHAPVPRHHVRRFGCHQDEARCPVKIEVPRNMTSNYEQGWAFFVKPDDCAPFLAAIDTWHAAVAAHDDARRVVLDALRTVVHHAKTLQAVIDAWPPAASLFGEMGGVPPVTDAAMAVLASATTRAPGPAEPE